MSDSVDKIFRKALEEVTVEPPARVWEAIDAHFALKQRRQRRLFWYGGVAAAAALLLAIGLVMRNGASGTRPPVPLADSGAKTICLENNEVASIMSRTSSIPAFKRRGTATRRVAPMENGEAIVLAVAGKTVDDGLREGRREVSIPLVNGEALRNQREYVRLLREEAMAARGEAVEKPKRTRTEATEKPAGEEKEKAEIKPERTRRAPESREEGRFSVGGYVSPGYTSGSYHQANTNSRSTQFSDEQMSGLFNVTGGVNFSVRPTKRISIETGIGYSRMGQKTDNMTVYAPTVTMSNSDKEVEASNVRVATPLGNVRSKAQAAVYTMDANIALKDADMPEGSIEQQFDAIEIPLLFRYRLNDNRVRFSLMGGFGASFMVRNETTLTYDGVSESMGETEGIRKFNISTNVGIGVEYPITKAISFRMEPGFKYYLQSLSKDGDIKFKPYTFTFSTGIGISF